MASGSFLAVPTVSSPQETECDLSLNHLFFLQFNDRNAVGGNDICS